MKKECSMCKYWQFHSEWCEKSCKRTVGRYVCHNYEKKVQEKEDDRQMYLFNDNKNILTLL